MLRKDVDLITAIQLKLMENEKLMESERRRQAHLDELNKNRSSTYYDRSEFVLLNSLSKRK